MVHSDAMAVAQFPGWGNEAGMHTFWLGMQEWLGEEGTLLVPTFTYSLTRQACFDRATSPSEVGLMTEQFRTLPGVARTRDPIFSVAVWGAGRDEVIAAGGHDCFGEESPFAWLAAHDGWIAGFACHPDRITFTQEWCAPGIVTTLCEDSIWPARLISPVLLKPLKVRTSGARGYLAGYRSGPYAVLILPQWQKC